MIQVRLSVPLTDLATSVQRVNISIMAPSVVALVSVRLWDTAYLAVTTVMSKVFEAFCGPKYPRVGPVWSPWHVSLVRDASVGDKTCLLAGMETSFEVNFANNARQSILA